MLKHNPKRIPGPLELAALPAALEPAVLRPALLRPVDGMARPAPEPLPFFNTAMKSSGDNELKNGKKTGSCSRIFCSLEICLLLVVHIFYAICSTWELEP